MELSQRILSIPPSATLTMNAKAQELKQKGENIISLAVGEPDFSPPEHVKEALITAVNDNCFQYLPVPGLPALREAGANYFYRFYQVQPEPQEIMFSNGGKQVLYNLFQVLLNPGEEVLIPAPYWVSYPPMVQLAGGVPKIIPTYLEDNFELSIETLKNSLTENTKILILNSPSNPTGVNYSQEKLTSLAQFALDKGLFVISDEVYDQLVYPPSQPASLARLWQNHKDKIAIVNALSKSFALTGLRVGFVLTAAPIIKAMTKLQSQSCSNICSVAQKAAIAALTGDFSFLEGERQKLKQRRDLTLEFLKDLGLKTPRPDGAFYVFPEVKKYFNSHLTNSTALCTYLLERAKIATVPGIAFGDDNCIRISYAVPTSVLEDALQRLKTALNEL
ncbi:MAG: pyridoxal phosphate-dependent aminotransferase [Desulfonauticus sp.]|nr:pyridoxal phosphate-dependent aminotransferase [Desulfonauticus sp.]